MDTTKIINSLFKLKNFGNFVPTLKKQNEFINIINTTINCIVQLQKEKDLLQEKTNQIIKQGVEDLCLLCKHYIKCEPKTCSDFISGDSVKDAKGNIIEWKWTCQDFNYGDCPKLENTPCYQCYKNDFSGFENIKGSQSH